MSALHKKRIYLIGFLVVGLATGAGLVLFALSKSIDLFYTPTQVAQQSITPNRTIRLGGMVVKQSVKRHDNLDIEFKVTDLKNETTIYYKGILPDLFREGQGIVALGKMDNQGNFRASEVLAKHDENYMPPEVAASLRSS